MNVKNASKVPIEIGHTSIAPGQVASIDDTLLYQPRVQKLRADGDLVFPFIADVPVAPPVEPPAPKKVVLEIHTDVPVQDEVTLEEKPSFRKRK